MANDQIEIDIDLSGPFFQFEHGPIVNKHIRAAISDLTDQATGEAKRIAGTFRKSGTYAGAIRGKTYKSGRGKVLVGARAKRYRAVIERGRYWESTGHRFEGYKVMSQAHRFIVPKVDSVVGRHINNLVRELGGST